MAIRTYELNGKQLWEVQVSSSNPRGKRIQRRRRGIETKKAALSVEFELKRELCLIKEGVIDYRWGEWIKICLDK